MSESELPRPVSDFIPEDPAWAANAGIKGTSMIANLDGYPAWEAILQVRAGPIEEFNIAGFRYSRHGGAHEADIAMQEGLITFLGAMTLCSGHIELEMKRILTAAKAEPRGSFKDVDDPWSKLESQLQEIARKRTPLAARLRPVLEWGTSQRLRERRNDAVHSAWNLFDTGHFEGVRTPFGKDAHSILDDGQGLAELVMMLREYLNRLQSVISWPSAILPPLPDDLPVKRISLSIAEAPPA